MRPARLLLCALLPLLWAAASPLPKPKLKPQRTQAIHAEMIKQGIALTDQRDYARALDTFQHVLEQNPDDVDAIYEMAYAYSQKKDYPNCISTARRGAQYKARNLALVYQVLGSCLDDAGQPEAAIQVFRAALRRYPADYLLHYNLALTYMKAKRPEEAKKSVKQAVALNPDHPSSHLMLGQLYLESRHNIPALMALGRFLTLEPYSQRSPQALALINRILGAGVKKGANGQTTILVGLNESRTDAEGDFTTADLVLKMGVASLDLPDVQKVAGDTPAQKLIHLLGLAFGSVSPGKTRKRASGFAQVYYAPYFTELHDRQFIEPFVYHAWQTADLPGGAAWLRDNHAKVSEFLAWSRKYDWKPAR
jgi:Tfp pilus assembly protein PilF